MSSNAEIITIDCPICGVSHSYNLEVERSVVVKMLTEYDMNEKPRVVHLTRFFSCPTKKEDFQATIIMHETSRSRIKSVKVIGLAEEPSDE